jgi:hypothetical protein
MIVFALFGWARLVLAADTKLYVLCAELAADGAVYLTGEEAHRELSEAVKRINQKEMPNLLASDEEVSVNALDPEASIRALSRLKGLSEFEGWDDPTRGLVWKIPVPKTSAVNFQEEAKFEKKLSAVQRATYPLWKYHRFKQFVFSMILMGGLAGGAALSFDYASVAFLPLALALGISVPLFKGLYTRAPAFDFDHLQRNHFVNSLRKNRFTPIRWLLDGQNLVMLKSIAEIKEYRPVLAVKITKRAYIRHIHPGWKSSDGLPPEPDRVILFLNSLEEKLKNPEGGDRVLLKRDIFLDTQKEEMIFWLRAL